VEETEKKDVIVEQEVVEPKKPETSSEDQPEVSKEAQEPTTGSKEYNWRQMEDKHTKEREQFQRKIWELEKEKEKFALKQQEEKEELKLEKDDLITYGQVDELVEKRAEKKARAIFQDEFQKAEKAKQPVQVKQKYPDFEKVVTEENIEKLKKEDPELEKLILLSNNPYERVYKEIRRSEFYKSTQANKESKEKIEANSKKPVSSNSFGKQRPLSYANDYAKGDKSLWEDMQKFRGGSL
jgi:hypothetical protein